MVSDTLRVVQWNARWISTNIKYLRQFLDEYTPHVISIQSLGVNFYNLPKLNGYFYPPVTNIPENKNGKLHTALYMRDDTQYVPILSPIPKESIDAYGSAITLKLNNLSDINIASVYYPKGPNNTTQKWLDEIDIDKKLWLITGDFNCHSPYWDKHSNHCSNTEFEGKIITSNLVILNDGRITRVPDIKNHKPSALDLTLVSPKLADLCTWDVCEDTLGSDHYPLIIDINDYEENLEEEDLIPRFNYKKADWEKYKQLLLGQDKTLN